MRILLVRLGAVGDLILALPAFHALREKYSCTHLTLLSNSPALKLLLECGIVDKAEFLDDPVWNPFFTESLNLPDLSGRFDMAVVWLKAADDPLIKNLRRSGIAKVYAKPSFPPTGNRDFMAKFLMAAGELPLTGEAVPRLTLKDEAFRLATEELKGMFPGAPRPVLALHPGAGSPKKMWPAEHFAEIGRRWMKERQGRVLLIEGPADAVTCGMVGKTLSPMGASFRTVREAPLALVAGLLKASSQYIGNDSGISHLAASMGTPSVILFGETDPAIWAPRGFHVKVLKGVSKTEPMRNVDEEDVWKILAN